MAGHFPVLWRRLSGGSFLFLAAVSVAFLVALPASRGAAAQQALVYDASPEEGAPIEVALQRLAGSATTLNGQYVRVTSNVLQPGGEPVQGKNGTSDFRFDAAAPTTADCITDAAACSAFDAVNVYYHIDRFAHEFWAERLGVDVDFQVDVTTHIAGSGGFAIAPERTMKIAVGDIFMLNAALSDDVLYHEYTHLMAWEVGWKSDRDSPEETKALGEGYADYFTSTYTNDPRFAEWVVTCPDRQHCEGPANDNEFRRLDLDQSEWNFQFGEPSQTLRYGFCLRFHEGDGKCKASFNNRTPQYTWGMIWGAALWDLRGVLGADVVDRLALEGMRRHARDTDFSGALAHLLDADFALWEGIHSDTIRDVFAARGVDLASVVSVENPDEAASPQPRQALISVWPNPAAERIHVDAPIGARIVLLDAIGREVLTAEPVGAHGATAGRGGARAERILETAHLPAGWYAVRVGDVVQPVILSR